MGMIPEASRTKCLTAAVTILGMTATDLSCAYGTTSKRRTETIFDDAGHLGVILASTHLYVHDTTLKSKAKSTSAKAPRRFTE